MENWYYALNGAQMGPVSQETLGKMLANGQLPPDSLVWCTGMPEWVAAHSLPVLNANRAAVVQPVLGYGVGDSGYQKSQIDFRYAGFWIRFGAGFIDGIITSIGSQIVAMMTGVFISTSVVPGGRAIGIAATAGGISGILIRWLYTALMQSSQIQGTVGMMVVGIRVTDLSGYRLTFGRATGRYFASLISSLICGVGYLMMLWSDRKQTLHDQIAKTVVIFNK